MSGGKASVTTNDRYYALAPRGEAEIRGAKTTLHPAALELLVRIDGATNVAQLHAGMPSMPFEEIVGRLAVLLRDKYIRLAESPTDDALRFDVMPGIARPAVTSVASVQQEAAEGLKALEKYGYYVRIARRPDSKPTLPTDRRPQAVIIEDEPHLAKFLKHFLSFEGFDVRVGQHRQEIVQVLRAQPMPDLVLLDVMLPDTNGFEVLTAIRQHPALRSVPVMMLTAESTRQSVIKGLATGADGYITKPFHTDNLVNAIQTIFGQAHSGACQWTYS
jgi:two-component system OmpR family response regulator